MPIPAVLVRELGDSSLPSQGRPCGRPPAALGRLSFVPSLPIIRRHVLAQPVFPPDRIAAAIRCTVEELPTGCCCHVGCGPSPLTPTADKHNMSNY
jgi:hypothetical protein